MEEHLDIRSVRCDPSSDEEMITTPWNSMPRRCLEKDGKMGPLKKAPYVVVIVTFIAQFKLIFLAKNNNSLNNISIFVHFTSVDKSSLVRRNEEGIQHF